MVTTSPYRTRPHASKRRTWRPTPPNAPCFLDRVLRELADEPIDPAELRTLPLPTAVMLACVLVARRGESPSVRKVHHLVGRSFRDINSIMHVMRQPK